jgi:uncharacterized membrane protein YesL
MLFWFYTTIGFILTVLAAGAVDGDASLTTLSVLSVVGSMFLILAMFENFKNGE